MAKAKRIFRVIAYDIQSDKKRLKVSKLLEKYGERVNYSVFECMVTHKQLQTIQDTILKHIDPQTDSVIYYPICVDCFSKITYHPEKKKIINTIQII